MYCNSSRIIPVPKGIILHTLGHHIRLIDLQINLHHQSFLGPAFRSSVEFQFLMSQCSVLLEHVWNAARRNISCPAKASAPPVPEPLASESSSSGSAQLEAPGTVSEGGAPPTSGATPVLMTKEKLSEFSVAVLCKGPKFSYPFRPSRVQQLAIVHRVASACLPEDRDPLIKGCLWSLSHVPYGVPCRVSQKDPAGLVRKELSGKQCILLEADKEARFVVLDPDEFNIRRSAALDKNFVVAEAGSADVVKRDVLHICKSNGLVGLAADIGKAKKGHLALFFTAKTHKEGIPLRSIVSERGCWQMSVGRFLQKSAFCCSRPTAVQDKGLAPVCGLPQAPSR